MHATMQLIVDSGNDGHVEMVSCENLVWLINVTLSVINVLGFRKVIFDLSHVDFRDPRVCINDGEQDFLDGDSVRNEELLFQLLGTPRYITCFSALLVFSQRMAGVSHDEKLIFMFLNKFLSFNVGFILVSLHGHKDHIVSFTSLMLSQLFDGLTQKFLIFLVAGNNKSVKDLIAVCVIIQSLNHFVRIHLLSSIQNSSCLEVGDGCYRDQERGFDCEMKEKIQTYFLVKLWEEEGSEEHQRPAGEIEEGYDKLIFVVVCEISEVHNEVGVEIIIYFIF